MSKMKIEDVVAELTSVGITDVRLAEITSVFCCRKTLCQAVCCRGA